MHQRCHSPGQVVLLDNLEFVRGATPAQQSPDVFAVAADGPEIVAATRDERPIGNLVACRLRRVRVNDGAELVVHPIQTELELACVSRGEQPHIAVQVDDSTGDTLVAEAGEIAD